MRSILLSLGFWVILITSANTQCVKYKIIDAPTANEIYAQTNGSSWTKNRDWPLPDGEVSTYGTPYGVTFVSGNSITLPYPEPECDTIIQDLHIASIDLSSNNLSGSFPNIKLDSLVLLKINNNDINSLGTIRADKLTELYISGTNIEALPQFNLPALHTIYAANCNITGALTQWNTPSLRVLSISINGLTSVDNLAYPQLEEIMLQGNEITGTLQRWATPNLKVLNLLDNQLTAVSSSLDYPNLEILELSYNNISGPIPNWNLPNLRQIYLTRNNFSGQLPNFNFPLIESFLVGHNDLSGEIPDYQFPNCTNFHAGFNSNLGGEIPNLYAPSLRSLTLAETSISGDLKNLDFPELEYLGFYYAKLDGEITEPLDLPNLEVCELDGNQLKGHLPDFNMPAMRDFRIGFNNFEGDFPNADMPQLERLHIQGNSFKSLPDFTGSGGFWNLECWNNYLHFDDVLPYKDIQRLEAYVMRPVPMYANAKGDSIVLSVSVRGDGNLFHWITSGDTIKSGTDTTLTIYQDQNVEHYTCRISNPQLPNMSMYSELAKPPAVLCWSNGIFKICIENPEGGWEPGEQENEIITNYPVSINDFIYFEGSIIVDTSDLTLQANGQFYARDITLPGGISGNFKLAEGEYSLSLAGSDGVITGFVNDALGTYVPNIGGLEIKLQDLKLLGGLNANGVSLAFTVSFNNITPSCGNTTGQTTEIKMEGLAITTNGISVDGLEVNDFGFAPGFCLKQLIASYNQSQDKLAFGLTLATPFIEVGGGLGFIAGDLDSIAMKAVLQNTIIPIGATGVGIIGCEGRVSNLTNPPWNMRFGGIFSAVASDDIFQLTSSVEYIPPTILKIEAGDGKFFNPPVYDDWWQIEGGIYGQIDIQSYKMKIGGNIDIAPYLDGNDKKFIGSGSIDLGYRTQNENGVFLGTFDGSVSIPELSDNWPFDWLSARIGLPYTVSSNGLVLSKKVTSYMIGDVNLGERIGDVQYRIEFDKGYESPDFFTLILKDTDVSRSRVDAFTYTFDIQEGTNFAVVRAVAEEPIPATTVTTPSGVEWNEASPPAAADIDRPSNTHKAFWTLYAPQAGTWSISLDVEAQIEVYTQQRQPTDFEIDVSQESNGISVSWDASIFGESDTIELFSGNTPSAANSYYLTTSPAVGGSAWIPNDLINAECSFYISAYAIINETPVFAVADDVLSGAGLGIAHPEDVIVEYDEQTGMITAEWLPATDPEIAGYVVHLIEGENVTPIAMLYSDESYFSHTIDIYNDQTLVFYSYADDGRVSCPSPEYELKTTSIGEPEEPAVDELLVYPNPANQVVNVKFLSDAYQDATLSVHTVEGKRVFRDKLALLKGVNEHRIRTDLWPSGMYFITVSTGQNILEARLIVLRD